MSTPPAQFIEQPQPVSAAPELAIIVPTYNERDNVEAVVKAVVRVMGAGAYEVIFVDDDSPDGTVSRILEIARTNPRVRVIRRIGRRGLGSACLEGMLATAAPILAVMDADLQHDESVLPQMIRFMRTGGYDVVVASRHLEGGSMGEFAKSRVLLSNLGLRLSRFVCRCDIGDPMSGFFVITRKFLDEVVYRTSGVGFKILVDLLASSKRPVRLGEVAYTFRNRLHGESKMDVIVGLEYLTLLLDKMFGGYIPVRFAMSGIIGAIGALRLGVRMLVKMPHFIFMRRFQDSIVDGQNAATGKGTTLMKHF